jgi:uncharacterized protein DUF3455
MKTRMLRLDSAWMLTAVGAMSVLACSSDDTTTPAPTGSGGAAGAAGGSAGAAGSGTAGSAGMGGAAGNVGTGGAADAAPPRDGSVRDVTPDCGVAGVIHTVPTVPPPIAAPAGVVLVAGYRAIGDQIYTCVPSPPDGGPVGDGGPAGTWLNTAVATLYGDNCAIAAQHSFTSGPTWGAADGSIVVGARVSAFSAPGADGGDGGGNAIPWLLLRAAVNTGEGTFGTVTYIHRLDTVGGLGPAGACDPVSDASATVRSPYSATYYFYNGGNAADGASESGPSEAGAD